MSEPTVPSPATAGTLSEELLRYHALFDNPVIGVRVSSVAEGGCIVDSNLAYRRMTGYTAAELRERTLFDLTHPEDRDRNRELYDELTAGRRTSYQIEKRLLRKVGTSFWTRLTALALRAPDGTATHHLGLVEDVDEHRRAQLAHAETSERFRSVLNAAIDGIVLIDTAGSIRLVNSAVQTMFGYTAEELQGQNLKVLMPAPYREEHDGYLARYLTTGEARIIGIGRQVQGRRRDGSTFPLDLAVSEVRHGGELFFLGTLRDISERVRLEAEIRQSQKMEAIGRLAGGVAHDFNTLLGTILGYSEMLLSTLPPDEALRTPVERIHRAAQLGAQVTRQLLLFSRRQDVETQMMDLESTFGDVNALLDRLLRDDVRLILEMEPHLGQVWGDPGEMHQVLLNLAVNACDAMPAGGTLTISLRSLDAARELPVVGGRLPPGPYVLLEVTDTGTGMDEQVQSHVFEPFFTTKDLGKGTGLGLTSVHAIVKRSRGGIDLESQPGAGTTFRIYLPVAAPARARQSAEAAVPRAAPPGGAGNGLSTILLVEDNEMFRGLVQEVLINQGYRVLAAEKPEAAMRLAAASGDAIHLLLSDMIMPGGTGADLARQLTGRFPQMKVVLMSGYTDEALASQEASRRAADAFLEKPFATRDLLQLVHELLASG
jgi:PAS domain S-box-containing protein